MYVVEKKYVNIIKLNSESYKLNKNSFLIKNLPNDRHNIANDYANICYKINIKEDEHCNNNSKWHNIFNFVEDNICLVCKK